MCFRELVLSSLWMIERSFNFKFKTSTQTLLVSKFPKSVSTYKLFSLGVWRHRFVGTSWMPARSSLSISRAWQASSSGNERKVRTSDRVLRKISITLRSGLLTHWTAKILTASAVSSFLERLRRKWSTGDWPSCPAFACSSAAPCRLSSAVDCWWWSWREREVAKT